MIECHAGQAWVLLHQPLGAPPLRPPQKHHRHPGPSRLRRREKRAQACAHAAAAENAVAAAEVATQTFIGSPQSFSVAVQANIEPVKTDEAAVQASLPDPYQPAHHHVQHYPQQQVPQPSHQQVRDIFCPDRVYDAAAAGQADLILPQLDGHDELEVIQCT